MVALAYLAGLSTPFLLYLAWCGVGYALLRDSGTQCMVCNHLRINIDGRRPRAYIWARKGWHSIWWRSRRWHRDAEAAHRAKWKRQ